MFLVGSSEGRKSKNWNCAATTVPQAAKKAIRTRIGRRTYGRSSMFLSKSGSSHSTVVTASASEVPDSQISASTMTAQEVVQVESPQTGRLQHRQAETRHFDELAAHPLDERVTF